MRLLAVLAGWLLLAPALGSPAEANDGWRSLLNGRRILVTISRDRGVGSPAVLHYTFLPSGDLRIESSMLSKHNLPNAKWRETRTGICWRFPPHPDFCYRFTRVADGWKLHDEIGDDPHRHMIFTD